jgi:phage I-like protein
VLGPIQRAEALLAVRDAAAVMAPLSGEISGIGRFTNGEQDVIYASLDAPKLNELQDFVSTILEANGFEIADDHGFTPHFTLSYIESGMPSPIEIVEPRPLEFGALHVWFGPEHITVPLPGMDAVGDGDGEADVEGTPYEYLAGKAREFTYLRGDRTWLTIPGKTITNHEGPTSSGTVTVDLADLAATGHMHRLFNSIAFAEAPAWIPYLPTPGVYAHPRYGNITITTACNARFVDNFVNKVYQDRLPIDAEHETKLSGAVGWITAMRVNADGSADAQVEWTDRGRAFFQGDRFRYFSPEWYDTWEDPATRTQHKDVAIGGAICTRPFFKPPALRPLFASESSLTINESDPQLQGDIMPEQETQQYDELRAQLAARETEIAALRSAGEQTNQQLTQTSERIQAMEVAARRERFVQLAKGADGGARWFGEHAKHVGLLEKLSSAFGEDSQEVKNYIETQRAAAELLKDSKLFEEIGSDTGGKPESNEQKASRLATERAEKTGESFEQAYTSVLEANLTLYA